MTAGSRGIANIPVILRAAVEHLKQLGAKPFLVPAMGSHGGGTAEGQRAVVESYGITEAAVGCPICSSMETVVVCHRQGHGDDDSQETGDHAADDVCQGHSEAAVTHELERFPFKRGEGRVTAAETGADQQTCVLPVYDLVGPLKTVVPSLLRMMIDLPPPSRMSPLMRRTLPAEFAPTRVTSEPR